MEGGLILSDAHTHPGTEWERREREEKGIVSLVCISTPMEAETVLARRGKYEIPTCGVHPWYAGQWGLKTMEGWMERCPVAGEIGMDSVWCGVPLDLQEEVFRRQLETACRQGKPVILHTKGEERRIAAIIREYPNRYLVHWYSCRDYLEEYLGLDCYFSIGPDVWWNRAVMDVVKKVPLNRLLTETDGMEAVKWAYEEGRKACGVGTKEDGLRFRGERKAEEGMGFEGEMDPGTVLRPESVRRLERRLSEGTGERPGGGAEAALKATLDTAAAILGIRPQDAGRRFRENLVSGFLGTGIK